MATVMTLLPQAASYALNKDRRLRIHSTAKASSTPRLNDSQSNPRCFPAKKNAWSRVWSRFGRKKAGFEKLDPLIEKWARGAVQENADVRSLSDDVLVSKLLTLVDGTDRGVQLGKYSQEEVAKIAGQLEGSCMPKPLESPLLFGDWDVVYSSNPTSPGGIYRTWLGRLLFSTKDMIQTVVAPDIVDNLVRFKLLGFVGGDVKLRGKLQPLDDKWIRVDFEAPALRIGPFKFQYGAMSSVKLAIIYLNEIVRLGRGSRGTLFVFRRR